MAQNGVGQKLNNRGMGSMDAKVLLLIALLAPILMLAAGIFARRENAEDNTRMDTRRMPWTWTSLFEHWLC